MHTRGTYACHIAGTKDLCIFCIHLQLQKLFAWNSYHVVWWVVGGGNCIYVQLICDAYCTKH